MQAQKLGFFDKVASPFVRKAVLWSFLGTGAAGYVAKSHIDDEAREAQTQSQILDLKFHDLASRREQEEKLNAALTKQQQELLVFRNQADNEKREFQQELAGLQQANKQLASELQETQGSLTQARAENGNTNGRLGNFEATLVSASTRISDAETKLTQAREDVTSVKKTLETKEDRDALVRIIEKTKPSCVMMSSNEGKGKWSGFFLKTNEDELFLATCAHSFKSAGDFVLTEITVEGQGFSFKITPPPFKDNRIAFFPTSDGTDFALIPLTDEVKKTLPAGIGLKFRDFEERPLKDGETVFSVGNPIGLANTVTTRTVTNSNRRKPFESSNDIPYVQIQPSPNPGDSGSALVDSKGELIAVVDLADLRGFAKQGYAVSGKHLKSVIEEICELPVMSEREKIEDCLEKANKPQILLVSSTAVAASMPKKTGLDALPVYDVTKKQELVARSQVIGPILWLITNADKFPPILKDKGLSIPVPPPPTPDEGPLLPPPDLLIPPLPEPAIPESEKLKPAPTPPFVEEAPPPPEETPISKAEKLPGDVAPPPPEK